MTDHQTRINMIKQQCRTWGVVNPVILDLLLTVPREDFVPANFRNLAFSDVGLPLGHNQYTLTPKEEAKILDKLAVNHSERVLEIGTGCGYFTALLAKQAKHVDSIDIFEDFVASASRKLQLHHISNVELTTGDGLSYESHESQHLSQIMYDVIVLTGSTLELPQKMLARLNQHGRLFALIGSAPIMDAVLVTKISAQEIKTEKLFQTYTASLISYSHRKQDSFVF